MSEANADRPLRAITLIVGAVFCFSISDAMAKLLSATISAIEINWLRYVAFAAFAAVLVARTSGRRVTVRSPTLQILRGLTLVSSALLFMYSIRIMPLAEAAAISFVSPLMIIALSVLMLGEIVTPRRWLAVAAGLLGMLVVLRPGTAAFQPVALLNIASSACWAVAVVLTRRMSGRDPATTTLLWSSCSGLVAMTLLLPLGFSVPSVGELSFGLLLGVIAAAGQYMMVQAYRFAAASLLAPFSYTALLWSILTGWAVFGDLPDLWTLVGAGIIAASGLYSARAERRG